MRQDQQLTLSPLGERPQQTNPSPFQTTGTGYNYVVHWGDGTSESGQTGDATHRYASAGNYTVSIGGAFPSIYFNDEGDTAKIREVTQWGNTAWTSMENAFYGANNLTVTATDAPDFIGSDEYGAYVLGSHFL